MVPCTPAAVTARASTSPTGVKTDRPLNPCGDPPGGVGHRALPADSRGRGAAEPGSADDRRSGQPRRQHHPGRSGHRCRRFQTTRWPPATDPNARRIIAHGLRNPFRFTTRPGTDELWIGDVGWNDWEEINRLPVPLGAVENFGWPCYEGAGRQAGYDGANLNICENLYAAARSGDRAVPCLQSQQLAWCRTRPVRPAARRWPDSSSNSPQRRTPTRPSTTTPSSSPTIPATASGSCRRARTAIPRPVRSAPSLQAAANPVNLETGPGGDLFYVDFDGGTIRRITYTSANQPPVAVATATPTTGPAPLTVTFDGSGSNDPDGDTLSYAWDLDGDGAFDDSTAAQPTYTYTATGTYTATLRVTDSRGASDTDSVTITVGNTAADRDHQLARRRHHLEGGRRDQLLRLRDRCPRRHAAGLGADVGADHAALPVELPLASRSRPSTGSPAAHSRLLIMSIRRTLSSG